MAIALMQHDGAMATLVHTSVHYYSMLDYGAHACVCSPPHSPDIQIVELSPGHAPQLLTAVGAPSQRHGVNHVDYALPQHHWATV